MTGIIQARSSEILPQSTMNTRDVRKMVEMFRKPRQNGNPLLISAHRGLRWNGVVENTVDAVRKAADAGLLSVEIDARMTSDGEIVLIHDDGLGRTTNVDQVLGRSDTYEPVSGKGFNPRVDSLPWKGVVEHLRQKDDNGNLTNEPVIRLGDLLRAVQEKSIDILVFLDVKDLPSISGAYDIVKQYKNAKGVSAMEWCIWKPPVSFIRTPQELEEQSWFKKCVQETGAAPLWIPVFDPADVEEEEALVLAKAWSQRPYVVSLEIGLYSPSGPFKGLVDWASSSGKSFGFFAALGDIANDHRPITQRLLHHEGFGHRTYDDILKPGQANDGHDHRGNLNLWQELGFSWTIADRASNMVDLFSRQATFMETSI